MDKKVKKKWVKALRSGEYQQATRRLYAEDRGDGQEGFCCLGVLCDLEYDGYWKVDEVDQGLIWSDASCSYQPATAKKSFLVPANGGRCKLQKMDDSTLMPKNFRRKLGITPKQEDTLSNMNDRGEDFFAIANWIEKNL